MTIDSSSRRRLVARAVTVLVLLALGWVVADQLGAALQITTSPKDVPAEDLTAATEPTEVPDYPDVPAVRLPSDDPLLRLAAGDYAKALGERTGSTPRIVVGAAGRGTAVVLDAGAGTGAEGYRLRESPAGMQVVAEDRRGAAAGLFQLADRIEAARPLPPADGTLVAPSLGLRLLDSGAVGVTPDPTAWAAGDDYSHNNHAFANAILPAAPYVDSNALAKDAADFRAFVDHGLEQGYNALAINGFLEYLTFSVVGDGNQVYPPGDPHRERALAMRTYFGPMLQYAHRMGMRLYLKTDMLALTTPLEDYLTRTLGAVDAEDPRLWEVYQAGLDELFTAMPYVDGVMVRIGEAGSVYDIPGWDYYSRLAVTTVPAVRHMLTAFTEVADGRDRDIIFRTWSVGVGAVGDLHTNAESYHEVLDGIDSRHLIVSTKFTLGDFYSHLPLNGTLDIGSHRRLVEFQGRREFESFGALPNDLSVLHQEALQRFLAANPHVEGVWLWTQDGGPWRAGPMTLYLKTGFWQLYDLNAYAMGRLSWDPGTNASELTADWARRTFSDDPATVDAICRAMALSRKAVTTGLYIGPYADLRVLALGLEPPPMMWIFEWDIVSGDSAVLGTIYDTSKDRLDEAVAGGEQAVAVAQQMQRLITDTEPSTWREASLRQHFVDTVDYQVDLFRTLAAYRAMVLRHEQWLDTGSAQAASQWAVAREAYLLARDQHLATYTGDLDLPPYEFTAADIGLQHAERDAPMAWVSRVLLVGLLLVLLLGSAPGQRLLRRGRLPGAVALRALWLGATRPWRLTLPKSVGRLDRVLVWLMPALAVLLSRLAFTWFAAPAYLALVLGAWVLFAVVLRLSVHGRDPWPMWAGVGGAAIMRTVLLLAVLASRGPGRYWFAFWTHPGSRAAYVTVAFAAFVWVLVVAGMVLRQAYRMTRRAAWGRVLTAVGIPLAVLGGLVAVIGLERALTAVNDQLALLPWGLSRILGITTYLGIPTALPAYVAALGVVTVGAGAGLWLLGGGRRSADQVSEAS